MYHIDNFRDAEELKYKVASDKVVVARLAELCEMLGYVEFDKPRSGFEVQKNKHGHDRYDIHPVDRTPPSFGMSLANFRFSVDPAALRYGEPVVSAMEPAAISSFLAINKSEIADTVSKSFAFQLSDTTSHTTSYSFTEGIRFGTGWKIGAKGKACVPFVSEGEVYAEVSGSYEVSFNATQGWTNARTTSFSSVDTQQYTGDIPPRSKRLIGLTVTRVKSDVSYAAEAVVGFGIDVVGLLREDDNAFHRKRGKGESANIAFWSFGLAESAGLEPVQGRSPGFGGDRSHAFLDIIDQYDHRHIPNYSEIDWKWMERRFGARLDANIDFFRKGVGVLMKGSFSSVRGVSAQIVADAPVPLSDDELQREIAGAPVPSSEGELHRKVTSPERLAGRRPVAYVGSLQRPLAEAPSALDADEAAGGRVLSIS
jgi:hypothetical protein